MLCPPAPQPISWAGAWLQSEEPPLPLGLKTERLHLTLGPMSADHKSSTQDPAHALWPLSLFWETFFYIFFFFYWKMSLWGNECQLVYIKIVNCLKNILWWLHEPAREGSPPKAAALGTLH